MRLWSFQRASVAATMLAQSRYYALWKFTSKGWQPAYRWMVRVMEARGITTRRHAPVWTWQACAPRGGPPTLSTARSLLSDDELMEGVTVLEMDVPATSIVLSSYFEWNRALDHAIERREEPPDFFQKMFRVSRRWKQDDIQACLPFVERKWIVTTRPLQLRPGDYDFDETRLA